MEEGEWVEDGPDDTPAKQNPGVWQLLLESLWTYQYTQVVCPLTQELAHVLYEETQGITDFAAKIYMLAQIRAIVTAPTPDAEVITSDIIRSVARDSLKQAQPVLAALRRGDTEFLSTVLDINPIAIDDYIQKAEKALKKTQPSPANTHSPNKTSTPTPYGEIPSPKLRRSKRAAKPRKKREKVEYDPSDLRAASAGAALTNTSVLDALQQAGHLGAAAEYIDDQENVG
jgi:hypothetical protein